MDTSLSVALEPGPIATNSDAKCPKAHEGVAGCDSCDTTGNKVSGVEAALGVALELAARAGRFDVVQILAGELHARRLERTAPAVADLDAARARRQTK